MAKTDNYLQFPLCLLAYGKDVPTRMAAIFAIAARTIGRGFIEKQGEDFIVEGFIAGIAPTEFGDVYDDSPSQREIVIGLHKLKFELNDELFESIVKNLEAADSFCAKMKSKYGNSSLVRIKAEYAIEALMGTGMSYRNFSILSGLYAAIGDKSYPVSITRDRIRAGAMGYKSSKMLFTKDGMVHQCGQRLLEEREDGTQPLTTNQVRYSLDILERNGHFGRVQANKNEVLFSHRIYPKNMRVMIYDGKTGQANIVKRRRQQDREFQKLIRQGYAAKSEQERVNIRGQVEALPAASSIPNEFTTAFPAGCPTVSPTEFTTAIPTLI
jgi:hypothetical protein